MRRFDWTDLGALTFVVVLIVALVGPVYALHKVKYRARSIINSGVVYTPPADNPIRTCWDPVPGAELYRLYAASPGEPWILVEETTDLCVTAYDGPGDVLFFDVRAVGEPGESPPEHGETAGGG